jgi:hypothetical protein
MTLLFIRIFFAVLSVAVGALIGSIYGHVLIGAVTGAVAAMLIRTIATWPLGCVFIRHASGLPVRRQVEAGAAALTAAVVMAAGVALLDQAWGPALAALPRLSAGVAAGAVLYVAVLALVSPATVRGAGGLVGAVLRRDDRALAAGLGESR